MLIKKPIDKKTCNVIFTLFMKYDPDHIPPTPNVLILPT